MSKQYLEFSVITLYASDIQASVDWFRKVLGFQVLQINSRHAEMKIGPGVTFI